MSAQHTPGPWFLPTENAGSAGTQVWARSGDVRIADCNSGGISLPGRQADARLISAAPDLLEACKTLIEWFARESDHAIDFQARIELCNLAETQALAAIEKATGAKP